MANERNINQIFTNRLFENCSNRVTGYNYSNRNFSEYKEGDVIFQAGDSANFVYLVISGNIKLKFRNSSRLIFKRTNDFFGDFEINKGTSRASSAVAVSDCVLFRIDKDTLKKIQSVENQIFLNMKSAEEADLRETEENKPRPDITTVLNLDRSPVKLDIFKRKNREMPVAENKDENPIDLKPESHVEENESGVVEENNTTEIPDLNAVIEESTRQTPVDESLKKELLGDDEDFANWNFATVDASQDQADEKIVFESPATDFDEKQIEERINARYEKKFEDYKKELFKNYELLIQSLSKLVPTFSIDETLELVVNVFTKHFNASFTYLFLVNEKTTDLELALPLSAKPLVAQYNDGLTGRAAATKRIIAIRNPAKDLRFNPKFDKPKDFTEGSVAYVPLNDTENKLVGVIQLGRALKDFSRENEETLKILAQQAGKIIQLSHLNAEKLKSEKLSAFGSISKFLMHDIKSPILTIKHYSNLISRIDVPDQIKKVLTMLSMQANSVVDIMQSTFDFSENSSSLKLQKTQFNEMMKNILELLSEYTESRNVKLFKKFGAEAIVNVDARRFFVVTFQIIKNACEAMPSGGRIFVNTELVDNSVVLNIRDEGTGIKPEIGNDLYKTFFSSGKENATGLGLSVSKFLIEKMNGKITYESKINEGTIFKISLPAAED